jgi:general secretion pathway protein B
MSYILDALRRADSERERASIPGLHTQPVPQGSADTKAGRGPRPWVWLTLGVVVVLMGQGLGRWLMHDDEAARLAQAPPGAWPGPPHQPPPPGMPQAGALLDVAAPQPPGALGGPPAGPDAGSLPPAEPTLLEPPPLPDTPRKPPPAKARAATPSAAPAPGAAELRIYAQNELPEDVRRSLPALQIGGSVYSEDSASRFLMVNGQLLHENDKPTADLVLERIELKSAVLIYKGYRYRISY